jgi:hypothetical protein
MNSAMQQDKIWKGQRGYMKDLYNQAQGLYNNFDKNQYDQQFSDLTEQMKGINEKTQGGWDTMLQGGIADPSLDAAIRQSMQSPSETGKMYESIVGGAGNTYIDPMVKAMKAGQMDNLNLQMPGLNIGAVNAGQSGSSRQGVAEALMRSQANNQMLDKEAMMRGEAYDKDLNWKMNIAQQADTNRGDAQDRAAQLLQNKNQMMTQGINANQQMQQNARALLDTAMQKGNLQYDAYNRYKDAIGGPIVLGSSSSMGSSSGDSSSKQKSSSIK